MTALPSGWAILAASCAAAACASAPSGGASDAACRSSLPRDQAPLTDVLDSAGLVREVSTLWEPAAGLTIATLQYDSAGAPDSVVVISEAMAEAARARLSTALQRQARRVGQKGGTVNIFLGDAQGPAPRRVRELRTCPPSLENTNQVRVLLVNEARALLELGYLEDGSEDTAYLRMLVGTDGRPSEVHVDRSSARLPVDEAAVRVMRGAVFAPARMEGIPVPAWVELPVRFQVPIPARQAPLGPPPAPMF